MDKKGKQTNNTVTNLNIAKGGKGHGRPPLLISILGIVSLTVVVGLVWLLLFIISALGGSLAGKQVGEDYIPHNIITILSLLVGAIGGIWAIVVSSRRAFKYSNKIIFAVVMLINTIASFMAIFQVLEIIRQIKAL